MERWELPRGWGWKQVSEIVEIHDRGRIPIKESQRIAGNTPYCGANGIIDYVDGHTHEGDFVLLAEDGGNFKGFEQSAYLMSGKFWANNHVHVLRGKEKLLDSKYLYFVLYFSDLTPYLTGATRPKLTQSALQKIIIPIPYPDDPARSLAEQRRIAARLETLLGEARALRAEVQSMRRDLAQVMESALAEAFNLDEKTPKWSIATIANVKGGKRLPKGETFAEGITPYPYIRVTDFQDFSVQIENLRYLKPETHQKIRRYTISKDDVYISIAGTIGLVGIIPERLDGANLTENAAKIVFRSEYRGKIIPKYLVYFLVSPDGKKQIEERSKAAGQPKLALERIETIEIPEVDVSEQRRIVASLERIAEETRALDASLAQDLRDLEALEQSILAAAFRGE